MRDRQLRTLDRGPCRESRVVAEAEYEAKEKESIEIFRSDRNGWCPGRFVPVFFFVYSTVSSVLPAIDADRPMQVAVRSKQRQCFS